MSRSYRGIEAKAFFNAWQTGGDASVRNLALTNDKAVIWYDDPNLLLKHPCDVFVPAARTSISGVQSELNELRKQNPYAIDIEELVMGMRPKLIAEGANHPISLEAETYLQAHGVAVLPDILVNCGGLIGCWVEWETRSAGKQVDEETHNAALKRIADTVKRTWHASVLRTLTPASSQSLLIWGLANKSQCKRSRLSAKGQLVIGPLMQRANTVCFLCLEEMKFSVAAFATAKAKHTS